MHELSIAESVVECVLSVAEDNGATCVEAVEIEVGVLRLVVPEALAEAFVALSEGTLAAGAELTITEVPASARCRLCGEVFQPEVGNFLCPKCFQADVQIGSGNDIILKAIVCQSGDEDESDSK